MNYSQDPVFQAIEKIRNPAAVEPILMETWEHWLGKRPYSLNVNPTLTYYRPFDCSRLVAEMTVVLEEELEPISLHLFFNTFSKQETVLEQVEMGYQVPIPPDAALPVFAIADWHTVVWTLPHAPCLPEVAALLQPEYFCPLLIAPEDLPEATKNYPAPRIFRYVPFKRAIFTWNSPKNEERYFIKLCTEEEFPKVVDNFTSIYDISDALSFSVPVPVVADPKSRTFSMRAVPGDQFTKIMHQTRPEPFARVGRLLAELHSCDLQPETVWTPEKELKKFDKAMAEVKLALPHLCPSLDAIADLLTGMAQEIDFPSNYPIHANLFGDQILYSSDRVGIVDWDTLSLGDPHYDIGRLIAHFVYLAGKERLLSNYVRSCVDALLQGYEGAIPWKLDLTCLVWHIATQLLFRGKISALRQLPENWIEHLEFVVAEAEWLIEGCSEYVHLPGLARVVAKVS
jgi:hypothetical protein